MYRLKIARYRTKLSDNYKTTILKWHSQYDSQINMCCHRCDNRAEVKLVPGRGKQEKRDWELELHVGSGVTPVMRISWQKGSTLRQEMCDISEHKDGRSSAGAVQTKSVANIVGEYTRIEWDGREIRERWRSRGEERPNIRFLWPAFRQWARFSGGGN